MEIYCLALLILVLLNRRVSLILLCLFVLALHCRAQDITSLEKIGPVVSFTKSDKGITLNCSDKSQVQLTVLAPDLIRVRASFSKTLPARDHSWAIAREKWQPTPWTVTETSDSITIVTAEVEAVVRRSTLLIESRDSRTHGPINVDDDAMRYYS